MDTAEQYNYTDAFRELQELVKKIEQGDILIDELSAKVKRAKVLIEICKSKLTETEEDVSKLIEGLLPDTD